MEESSVAQLLTCCIIPSVGVHIQEIFCGKLFGLAVKVAVRFVGPVQFAGPEIETAKEVIGLSTTKVALAF
jgi:hypothetical protein